MPAAQWAVARRYSEFFQLHQQLRARFDSVKQLEFPRRRVVMKLQKDFLEKRRIALDKYLKVGLCSSGFTNNLTDPSDRLCFSSQMYVAVENSGLSFPSKVLHRSQISLNPTPMMNVGTSYLVFTIPSRMEWMMFWEIYLF